MIEWKPIQDYEDLYEISNTGEIRCLKPRYKNVEFLKQSKNSKGYLIVSLAKNKIQKYYSVHRLVAIAFLPNPNGYPCVNHIDEDKTNNDVSNLEWCTYRHNNIHGTRLLRSSSSRGKPIYCVETGEIFENSYIASVKTGIPQSLIWRCANKVRKSTHGFHFEYC